jgi:hypothetical protein
VNDFSDAFKEQMSKMLLSGSVALRVVSIAGTAVTVDRVDFLITLEKNLQIYEENELYEGCAKIVEAMKFLKDKKK